MIEVFWNLAGRATRIGTTPQEPEYDPLRHPAIEKMDERQIADLPLRQAPQPVEPAACCC